MSCPILNVIFFKKKIANKLEDEGFCPHGTQLGESSCRALEPPALHAEGPECNRWCLHLKILSCCEARWTCSLSLIAAWSCQVSHFAFLSFLKKVHSAK